MKKLGTLLAFYFFLITQSFAGVTCTLPFTLTNGTTADATQVMANYNALVACFTQAAANGVNNDITQLTGLSTALNPSEGGSNVFIGGTSTGTANAQVVAVTIPAGFALTNGWRVVFKAGFTNTGATQLNVNGTGLTNLFKPGSGGPVALTGGEIVATNIVQAIYDGTQFELVAVLPNGGIGGSTSISSAATTDLGTVGSHNALITGTTTITSFGSSASAAFPYYQVCFNNVVTITYNASSLIIPGAQNLVTAANDCGSLLYLGSGNWQIVDYTRSANPPFALFAPNIQTTNAATSGTYTTPTAGGSLPLYLHVRMCAGGGGGGGQTANNGSSGGASNFGSWTVNGGGGGGVSGGGGGSGGTGGTNSTGTLILRLTGAQGGGGQGGGSGIQLSGGLGGASFFGGGGSSEGNVAGGNASTNCAGGGGAGGSNNNSSAGGGAGEYVEFVITSPAASYGFVNGGGGNGGAAGGLAGGNGAPGEIIVKAYWQ